MLYFSIFLIITLFANFLVTANLEKKVVMAEVPLQKEILGAKNNNLQKNTAIEQRSNIFSYFTFTQDSLVFDQA